VKLRLYRYCSITWSLTDSSFEVLQSRKNSREEASRGTCALLMGSLVCPRNHSVCCAGALTRNMSPSCQLAAIEQQHARKWPR
jgi:hypothetical protein